MNHTIGISEMHVTNDTTLNLVTYSLGSCIGVTMYDPVAKVGGMIHCLLPLSKTDKEKSKTTPCMFTDTGIVALLQAMLNAGANKDRLVIKVAGGASPMDTMGRFKIGERNYTVLRKVLWKNDLMIKGEDVGGTIPRTLFLDLDTGETAIRTSGKETIL